MRISVVIAVKDRLPLLRRSLQSWMDHDYPDYEVILVDDGSKNLAMVKGAVKEFEKRISDLQSIRLESSGDRTPTYAWNAGFKKSTGDFVVFTGGDFIISQKDLLKKLVEGAKDKTRLSVVALFLSQAMTNALDTIPWQSNPLLIQSLPGFWEYMDGTKILNNRDIAKPWLAGIHTYLTGQLRKDWEYFGLFREEMSHLVADQDVHLRELKLGWRVDTPKEIHCYHQWHPRPQVPIGGSHTYTTEEQARLK